MIRAGFVALGLLAGFARQTGPSSDEARLLEGVASGRFAETLAALEKLPKDSPYRPLLEGPLKRLAGLRERLVAAIDKGGVEVDLKAVHPEARRGGKIVGATESVLKVEDEERQRQVLWGGLPPRVTVALLKAFMKEEIAKEPAILRDLLEAIGNPEDLQAVDAARAADLETVRSVRRALGGRDAAPARKALEDRPLREDESPWLKLVRLWMKRLEDGLARHKARRKEIEEGLPKGAKLHFLEDFEEGPEQISVAWERGVTVPPPDGASDASRWCRKSVFVGKGLGWGEMIDQYHADALPRESAKPICTMEPRLTFSARIWATNVRQLNIALDNCPSDRGERYSIVPVEIPKNDGWTRIKIRLDELEKHHPFTSGMTLPLLKMGDPIWRIIFKAHRADKGREEGYFYLDDVRIVTASEDE